MLMPFRGSKLPPGFCHIAKFEVQQHGANPPDASLGLMFMYSTHDAWLLCSFWSSLVKG